jgi:glutaconate CoA-transferase subunit A
MVRGVVEACNGAHFTSCEPDYGRDEAFQGEYAAAAADPTAWAAFHDTYLSGDEASYQAAVAARTAVPA